MDGDSWKYEGEAGEITRALDGAEKRGSFKTTKKLSHKVGLVGYKDFSLFANGIRGTIPTRIESSSELSRKLFLEELGAKLNGGGTKGNRLVLRGEPVRRGLFGKAGFLTLVGFPVGYSHESPDFSVDKREGIGTAYFGLDLLMGMNDYKRIRAIFSREPQLLNDAVFRMNGPIFRGQEVDLWTNFMMPNGVGMTREIMEGAYKESGSNLARSQLYNYAFPAEIDLA